MGFSLLLPSALNVSVLPVSFPPFLSPDVFNCDPFYSYPSPPIISDCQAAFRELPEGEQPMIWYNKPAAGEQRNVLPLKVHHGTCEIMFHTSGQSAATTDHFSILPYDIRTMAAWALTHCGTHNKGGMVTKGLENTISAITANPNTKFFPSPPLPSSANFYSLHIWNHMDSGDADWNPGNSDWAAGGAIDDHLIDAYREAPAGSSAKTELERRQEWVLDAVGPQEYWPITNWWDGKPSGLSSSGASRGTGGVETA